MPRTCVPGHAERRTGHEWQPPPPQWLTGQGPARPGRTPVSSSRSQTRTRTHTGTSTHTHLCTHTHTHSVGLVRLTPSRTPQPLPASPSAREARLARLPLLVGTTRAKAHFQRRRPGPRHAAPTGPAPPLGGRGGSCAANATPAVPGAAGRPRTLHDVTRPDRRKEQAPRSCKMQETVPCPALADPTADAGQRLRVRPAQPAFGAGGRFGVSVMT